MLSKAIVITKILQANHTLKCFNFFLTQISDTFIYEAEKDEKNTTDFSPINRQ